MKSENLPIQHLTMKDSRTITAALTFTYSVFYGEDKHLATEDERCSQERLLRVIEKLMPNDGGDE